MVLIPLEVWSPSSPATVDTSGEWSFIVARHFAGDEFDRAMAVIDCESGFDPTAANPESSALVGWQFLVGTWDWVQADSGRSRVARQKGRRLVPLVSVQVLLVGRRRLD